MDSSSKKEVWGLSLEKERRLISDFRTFSDEKAQNDRDLEKSELEFRLDRANHKINLLELRIRTTTEQLNELRMELNSKIKKNNIDAERVEALLDKHNHIILTFEKKMSQMQRLMEEQQIQLVNSQALVHKLRSQNY